jgi:urease accessory protein
MAAISTLLDTLHLASPALPVGGFAYSQGLEQAVEEGWVNDLDSAKTWIHDSLALFLGRQELPLWRCCYRAVATDDLSGFVDLNQELLSLRETAESRLESLQMGQSLGKIFDQWSVAATIDSDQPLSFTAAHAGLCALRKIDAADGLTAYAWAWVENQALAAMKIIPLGQRAGQSLLHDLKPVIAQVVAQSAEVPVQAIGSAAIGLAITSSHHETQYSRLFRS